MAAFQSERQSLKKECFKSVTFGCKMLTLVVQLTKKNFSKDVKFKEDELNLHFCNSKSITEFPILVKGLLLYAVIIY